MDEIAFCQLASISECNSTIQKRLIHIQSEDEVPVIFHTHGWSDFWIKCSERFPELWGDVKLLLLTFAMTYVAEQGFCQALHMRSKNCNRLDMKNIGETL